MQPQVTALYVYRMEKLGTSAIYKAHADIHSKHYNEAGGEEGRSGIKECLK